MIISISHEYFWTENGPIKHNIQPHFLIKNDGREIPLVNEVVKISEPFEMDSSVNWDSKVKVRKVYITKPSVTPQVSNEYYKLGFESYEQSVPFLTRVTVDSEATGTWPWKTDEWITLNCMCLI